MQRYEDRNMRIHDGWELYCGKVVDRRSLGANGGKLTVPTIARVLHFFLLQTEIPSCGGGYQHLWIIGLGLDCLVRPCHC